MGVRGLTSLVCSNEDSLLTRRRLNNTRLVIDGSNLLYYLHHVSAVVNDSKDHIFGGDYLRFASNVRTFFHNLSRCRITAIVVFDGGSDLDDSKYKTQMERLENQLRQCRSVSKNGAGNGCILPVLARDVFIRILRELKVAFVQSTFEADNDILMIANDFNCPVLSNDSDFFIFDLKGGFVLLNTFDFISVKEAQSANGNECFIECKCFHVDLLLNHFPGLNKSLLPLFGCLMGNDYVEQTIFTNVFNSLPNDDTRKLNKRKQLRVGSNQQKMIKLLNWMCCKSKDDIVSGLLRFIKSAQRQEAIKLIETTLNNYGVNFNTNLLTYLRSGKLVFDNSSVSGTSLPFWFLETFNKGNISGYTMDVIMKKRLLLTPQVEDFSLTSCYLCSENIQKVYFEILSLNATEKREVVVFGRKDGNVCKYTYKVNESGTELNLNSIPNVSSEEKINFMFRLINCKQKFDFLEKNLQEFARDLKMTIAWQELIILICIVDYWLEETNTENLWLEFVVALITSIVYNILNNNQCRSASGDIINIAPNFKKYQTAFVPKNGKPFESRIIHFYSELQAVVMFFTNVNSCLESPISDIRSECFFNGILMYNLTSEFLNRPLPVEYASQLLGMDSNAAVLFRFIFKFLTAEKRIERKVKNISKRKSNAKKKAEVEAKINQELSRFGLLNLDES